MFSVTHKYLNYRLKVLIHYKMNTLFDMQYKIQEVIVTTTFPQKDRMNTFIM